MKINEIEAKSIITDSKLPGCDVVVNPYVGCSFACGYCYASFMGRFVGHSVEDWGEYVYVKANAVTLFKREIAGLMKRSPDATLMMSSVTDAWQGLEKKYRLARGILETLVTSRYLGLVSLLTKSPLINRDIDLIRSLSSAEVGVTITSSEDAIGRELEARAPANSDRFAILRAFNKAGIPTYAFIGPLLPHFSQHPALLDVLFQQLADCGTTTIFAEHLNTSAYIRKRIAPIVAEQPEETRAAYASARSTQQRKALGDVIEELVSRYRFSLRMHSVLDHREDSSNQRRRGGARGRGEHPR